MIHIAKKHTPIGPLWCLVRAEGFNPKSEGWDELIAYLDRLNGGVYE